jgi:hypothetical protein
LERQRGRREISWVEELGHRICILGDSHLNHFRSGKLRHENPTTTGRRCFVFSTDPEIPDYKMLTRAGNVV